MRKMKKRQCENYKYPHKKTDFDFTYVIPENDLAFSNVVFFKIISKV